MNKNIKPANQNKLKSDINLRLEHNDYNFNSGFHIIRKFELEKIVIVISMFYPIIIFQNNLYRNTLANLNFNSSGNNNLYPNKSINKYRK
jgi:LPS-assembly protein